MEKVDLPWQMVIMRRGDAVRRCRLCSLIWHVRFCHCRPVRRDESAVILRIASRQAPRPRLLDGWTSFADDDAQCTVGTDRNRGIFKRVLVGENGSIDGVRLTGETAARDWLKD